MKGKWDFNLGGIKAELGVQDGNIYIKNLLYTKRDFENRVSVGYQSGCFMIKPGISYL